MELQWLPTPCRGQSRATTIQDLILRATRKGSLHKRFEMYNFRRSRILNIKTKKGDYS